MNDVVKEIRNEEKTIREEVDGVIFELCDYAHELKQQGNDDVAEVAKAIAYLVNARAHFFWWKEW